MISKYSPSELPTTMKSNANREQLLNCVKPTFHYSPESARPNSKADKVFWLQVADFFALCLRLGYQLPVHNFGSVERQLKRDVIKLTKKVFVLRISCQMHTA